jgi:hypothetical protein
MSVRRRSAVRKRRVARDFGCPLARGAVQATGRARPTLLRVESDAGHGFGSTETQLEEEFADIYAFALWRSGVDATKAPSARRER